MILYGSTRLPLKIGAGCWAGGACSGAGAASGDDEDEETLQEEPMERISRPKQGRLGVKAVAVVASRGKAATRSKSNRLDMVLDRSGGLLVVVVDLLAVVVVVDVVDLRIWSSSKVDWKQ